MERKFNNSIANKGETLYNLFSVGKKVQFFSQMIVYIYYYISRRTVNGKKCFRNDT